jgi:hypothetical protein
VGVGQPRVAENVGRRDAVVQGSLWAAATAGTLHALFSLYWAFGGGWLLETLGTRILDQFEELRWALVPVGVVKLAGAWVPVALDRRGWPRPRIWRPVCWTGVAILIAWGDVNTVVGQLVLTGVIDPDGGYDRPGMIGHAWLWDPLFLLWGAALAIGLWRSRGRTTA